MICSVTRASEHLHRSSILDPCFWYGVHEGSRCSSHFYKSDLILSCFGLTSLEKWHFQIVKQPHFPVPEANTRFLFSGM